MSQKSQKGVDIAVAVLGSVLGATLIAVICVYACEYAKTYNRGGTNTGAVVVRGGRAHVGRRTARVRAAGAEKVGTEKAAAVVKAADTKGGKLWRKKKGSSQGDGCDGSDFAYGESNKFTYDEKNDFSYNEINNFNFIYYETNSLDTSLESNDTKKGQ
jgi:hypothetical protein